MSLLKTILETEKKALKDSKKLKVETLRYLKSLIKNKEIEKRAPLKDSEILQIIRKEIANLNQTLLFATRGARDELIEKTQSEIQILKAFLPKELTDSEIDQAIQKYLGRGFKKGEIIGKLIKEIGDRCAPARIAERVNLLFYQK